MSMNVNLFDWFEEQFDVGVASDLARLWYCIVSGVGVFIVLVGLAMVQFDFELLGAGLSGRLMQAGLFCVSVFVVMGVRDFVERKELVGYVFSVLSAVVVPLFVLLLFAYFVSWRTSMSGFSVLVTPFVLSPVLLLGSVWAVEYLGSVRVRPGGCYE